MADQDIQLAQAMSAVAMADAPYRGRYDCGQYAHASAPPLEAEPEICVQSEAEAVPIVVADAGEDFANKNS